VVFDGADGGFSRTKIWMNHPLGDCSRSIRTSQNTAVPNGTQVPLQAFSSRRRLRGCKCGLMVLSMRGCHRPCLLNDLASWVAPIQRGSSSIDKRQRSAPKTISGGRPQTSFLKNEQYMVPSDKLEHTLGKPRLYGVIRAPLAMHCFLIPLSQRKFTSSICRE